MGSWKATLPSYPQTSLVNHFLSAVCQLLELSFFIFRGCVESSRAVPHAETRLGTAERHEQLQRLTPCGAPDGVWVNGKGEGGAAVHQAVFAESAFAQASPSELVHKRFLKQPSIFFFSKQPLLERVRAVAPKAYCQSAPLNNSPLNY